MSKLQLELLAAKQHDIWSHWMKYQFSKCIPQKVMSKNATTGQMEEIETGNLVIPKSLVERWTRQMETDYVHLTEEEKQSDRNQVKKFAQLINK